MKKQKKISKISVLHFTKLVSRSILFLTALTIYITGLHNKSNEILSEYKNIYFIFGFIWLVYFVEMLLRFFPSKIESPGCQKQFKRNYKPSGQPNPILMPWKRTFLVAAVWIILNGIIGILYFRRIIDAGILILISLFYGVSDMICILFFCPFQTLFMKNRCCTDCRIYNWDFAMMFTPLIFIPNPYTISLIGLSVMLLIRWELTLRLHPERFAENTNCSISCQNCNEKLCYHKKQLRVLWRHNSERIKLKGNQIIDITKEKFNKK
jgi:hypothetical protein